MAVLRALLPVGLRCVQVLPQPSRGLTGPVATASPCPSTPPLWHLWPFSQGSGGLCTARPLGPFKVASLLGASLSGPLTSMITLLLASFSEEEKDLSGLKGTQGLESYNWDQSLGGTRFGRGGKGVGSAYWGERGPLDWRSLAVLIGLGPCGIFFLKHRWAQLYQELEPQWEVGRRGKGHRRGSGAFSPKLMVSRVGRESS